MKMNATRMLAAILCRTILFVSTAHAQTNHIYDVRAFGAAGDDVTLDTKAIQATIDQCSASGGGIV